MKRKNFFHGGGASGFRCVRILVGVVCAAQAIAPVLLPPAYGAAVGRVERWLILAGVAPLLLTSLLDAGVV